MTTLPRRTPKKDKKKHFGNRHNRIEIYHPISKQLIPIEINRRSWATFHWFKNRYIHGKAQNMGTFAVSIIKELQTIKQKLDSTSHCTHIFFIWIENVGGTPQHLESPSTKKQDNTALLQNPISLVLEQQWIYTVSPFHLDFYIYVF